jgi:hypothetical protein
MKDKLRQEGHTPRLYFHPARKGALILDHGGDYAATSSFTGQVEP